MKKIILLLLLVLPVVCYSQTTQKHLSIMGINFNLPYAQFKQRLANKGFKFVRKDASGFETFSGGTFTGDKARLDVAFTPISKKVSFIVVSFLKEFTESGLESKENQICSALEAKYGKPKIDEDGGKSWDLEEGTIFPLSKEGTLTIIYLDAINVKKQGEEKQKLNMEDL